MEFVIGAIAAVALFLIYAAVSRKTCTSEIDELDTKKTEIVHRPVHEELAKVKRLNMTGQAEALFDRWRSEWDEVVTVDIPAVDEQLFQAEALVDKMRYGAAKKQTKEVSSHLEKIEKKVDVILIELNQLIGSEEKNREEGEAMHMRQREAKKRLLAHRHTFGKAAAVLEVQLDALMNRFDQFADLTESGNYLEARELLIGIQAEMNGIEHKLNRIPDLITQVNHTLPGQVSDIEQGYKEMKQDGYMLDHLQIDKELAVLKEDLHRCRELLVKTEVDETSIIVNDVKDSLDFFYDLLEKEVLAKHEVLKDGGETGYAIDDVITRNDALVEQMEEVKKSYQLKGDEADVPKRLKEDMYHLEKQYDILYGRIEQEQTAYSFLHDELKDIKARIDEMKKQQEGFSAFLKTLRKDELAAVNELSSLRSTVQLITRNVKQSNMPGIPDYYRDLSEEARVRLHETSQALDEKPLHMEAVHEKLAAAKGAVELLANKTDELIEQVGLAEHMIQYSNRYRRTHPAIVPKLNEAESAFRQADYATALEVCATAIDKVDSKGLKRFEAQYAEKQD